ncbi:MAG: prepilin-type N-terminal cleavage/methylation domain-containing protein [Coriobacteriales bacterium]|jgi:prepilin-type N-terminal cleavage/methylation domain-containing protein|nr:prepilin-type N-terminal cleavage/methylation domain-containing protein [Coriobacteriales bacterium]
MAVEESPVLLHNTKATAKAGFTLVEVIVVLVILAILAAIAIPALTGYIEKARQEGYKAEARQFMTGMQTLVSEYWFTGTRTPRSSSSISFDMYSGGKLILAAWDWGGLSGNPPSPYWNIVNGSWAELGQYVEIPDSPKGVPVKGAWYRYFRIYVDENGKVFAWTYPIASTLKFVKTDGNVDIYEGYAVTYDYDTYGQAYKPGAGMVVRPISNVQVEN